MNWLTADLSELLARRLKGRAVGSLGGEATGAKPIPSHWESVKIWSTFLGCLACSLAGVVLSLMVFGTTITGTKKWGVVIVVSVAMLGLSYGAKYSNADARKSFSPVDVLQYLTQGFLWPSTWPALADLVGIQKVAPPASAYLQHALEKLSLVGTIFG